MLTILLDMQGNDSRRGAGLILINLIGQCGPVLGTRLYPKNEGPRYAKGMGICAGFMFLAAIVSLALRFHLVWKNKKLDEQYGNVRTSGRLTTSDTQDGNAGIMGEENEGPGLRFIL